MGSQSACKADIGQTHDCEDIASWECYRNGFRDDCCDTCRTYKYNISLPIQGCDYGDRVPGCINIVGPNGRNCYNSTIRTDCCEECYYRETGIQDCRYGDRAGMCSGSLCDTYSQQKLYDCCDTCYSGTSETTTSLPPLTTTTENDTTYTSTHSNNSVIPTEGGSSSGMPDWVIPTVASVGGLLLIAVAVIVFIIYRRKGGKPTFLTNKMYNDYKISKRAPIAPPRPDVENQSKLRRQDSDVYAYINPDEVKSETTSRTEQISRFEQTNDVQRRRSGNDPLPVRPEVDTYISAPDKYGYVEPVGRKSNPDPYTDLQTGSVKLEPYANLKTGSVNSDAYTTLQTGSGQQTGSDQYTGSGQQQPYTNLINNSSEQIRRQNTYITQPQ